MPIFDYAVHDRGTEHAEAKEPCQDSWSVMDCVSGFKVAAVADGLGSCPHSQISANLATSLSTRFIQRFFPRNPGTPSLQALMITALNFTEKGIRERLDTLGIPIEEAHTTLTVVLYDGKRVVFGHSGDGAVFGLREDGGYDVICDPIKGSFINSTVPFTYGSNYWSVHAVEKSYASIMICTDGVADVVQPFYLRPRRELMEAHANFFMHPVELELNGDYTEEASLALGKSTLAAIRDPENKTWSQLTDDTTAVILLDTEANPPLMRGMQDKDFLHSRLIEFYNAEEDDPEPDVDNSEADSESESLDETDELVQQTSTDDSGPKEDDGKNIHSAEDPPNDEIPQRKPSHMAYIFQRISFFPITVRRIR